MYDVSEIRKLRKKLDITQAQLAYESGVSQSLIAKIEANLIDPSYSKAQKIFDALDRASNKTEIVAKDIMNPKILSINPTDTVEKAIKKMKLTEISQLPVFDQKQLVGLISEAALVEMIIEKPNVNYKNIQIKDIMSQAPPSIAENTPHTAVSSLLKFFPLVLINKKGKFLGLITKSDFIRNIYKR